jgi:hypothetical protein
MFHELVDIFRFDVTVETGTYAGDTTGYLASRLQHDVYTSEANCIFYSLARSRLAGFPNVHCYLDDSRHFLKTMLEPRLKASRSGRPVFFYLDAHWQEDLPLREEIEIVVGNVDKSVIMIDDFRVPNDDGYGWDNYGHKEALDLLTFIDLCLANEPSHRGSLA